MHTGGHLGQKSVTLPVAGTQDIGDFAIFDKKHRKLS
jgi:hypothetical protein